MEIARRTTAYQSQAQIAISDNLLSSVIFYSQNLVVIPKCFLAVAALHHRFHTALRATTQTPLWMITGTEIEQELSSSITLAARGTSQQICVTRYTMAQARAAPVGTMVLDDRRQGSAATRGDESLSKGQQSYVWQTRR